MQQPDEKKRKIDQTENFAEDFSHAYLYNDLDAYLKLKAREDFSEKLAQFFSQQPDFFYSPFHFGAAVRRELEQPVDQRLYLDVLQILPALQREKLMNGFVFEDFCQVVATGQMDFIQYLLSFYSRQQQLAIIKYDNFRVLRYATTTMKFNGFCRDLQSAEKLQYFFVLLRNTRFFDGDNKLEIYCALLRLAIRNDVQEAKEFLLGELAEEAEDVKIKMLSANNYEVWIDAVRACDHALLATLLDLVKAEHRLTLLTLSVAWLKVFAQVIYNEYAYTTEYPLTTGKSIIPMTADHHKWLQQQFDNCRMALVEHYHNEQDNIAYLLTQLREVTHYIHDATFHGSEYHKVSIVIPRLSHYFLEDTICTALSVRIKEPDQQHIVRSMRSAKQMTLWSQTLDLVHHKEAKHQGVDLMGNVMHAHWLQTMRPLFDFDRNTVIAQFRLLVKNKSGKLKYIHLPLKDPKSTIVIANQYDQIFECYQKYKRHTLSLLNRDHDYPYDADDRNVLHSEKLLLLWLDQHLQNMVDRLKELQIQKLKDIVFDMVSLNQMCDSCRLMLFGWMNSENLQDGFLYRLKQQLVTANISTPKDGVRVVPVVSSYQPMKTKWDQIHGVTPDKATSVPVITSDVSLTPPLLSPYFVKAGSDKIHRNEEAFIAFAKRQSAERKTTLSSIEDGPDLITHNYPRHKVYYLGQQQLSIKQLTKRDGQIKNQVILCSAQKAGELMTRYPLTEAKPLQQFSLFCSGGKDASPELQQTWERLQSKQ